LVNQIKPDRFGVNLLRDGDNAFKFSDLFEQYKKWLPKWADHFEVSHFNGISLEYVNFLNKSTVPDFYSGTQLDLGNVITMFGDIPVPAESMPPPYSCLANFVVSSSYPCRSRVKISDAGVLGVGVDIQLSSRTKEALLSVDQCIEQAHEFGSTL
jgi:hypothetical protein